MIPISKLLEVRHDLSLVQYKTRCFALLLLDDPADAPLITQSIAQINMYSPQRIHLTHQLHTLAYASILVVEMHYYSNIQQTYFTYLVWSWSQRVPAWMHVWDTLEHDALRRDFNVPQYMDSELAANRMFIRKGEAFIVNLGYSQDNPHGELIEEITIESAAHALYAGHVQSAPQTTADMVTVFRGPEADAHFLNHVSDVQGVFLPKSFGQMLSEHPYLLTWSRDLDLSHIDFSVISADLDPKNECKYTVAMPNTSTCPDNVPCNLTVSEYASLCIKSNIVAQYGADVKRGEVSATVFSSEYVMKQLRMCGWTKSQQKAQTVGGESRPCVQDWSKPISFNIGVTKEASEEYEEEKSIGAIESILQKVEKELDEEMNAMEDGGGTGAGLNAGDIDMDDFMEFYAKNYLKMTDQELESHRAQPPEPDWSAYNDDSDYVSE